MQVIRLVRVNGLPHLTVELAAEPLRFETLHPHSKGIVDLARQADGRLERADRRGKYMATS